MWADANVYRIWQCEQCHWQSNRITSGCVVPMLKACPKCGGKVEVETKRLSFWEKLF